MNQTRLSRSSSVDERRIGRRGPFLRSLTVVGSELAAIRPAPCGGPERTHTLASTSPASTNDPQRRDMQYVAQALEQLAEQGVHWQMGQCRISNLLDGLKCGDRSFQGNSAFFASSRAA